MLFQFDMASVSSSKTSEKKEDKKVSLDQFMRNHTSEDNESFYELMKESEADFRRTHSWMFKAEEQLSIENKSEQLALPSIEMQAKGSETKSTRPLDGWTYKNVNSVFYHPDGAAFTDAEKIEMAKKEKLIVSLPIYTILCWYDCFANLMVTRCRYIITELYDKFEKALIIVAAKTNHVLSWNKIYVFKNCMTGWPP